MEARHYKRLDHGKALCELCPHNCRISTSGTGVCGARKNINGILHSEIYGRLSSIAMDPIEKKPLYHFFPGSQILSIGTIGCNLKCPYCQNWHISQNLSAETKQYSPEAVVNIGLKNSSIGIAYTYSEPVIWFEYVMDTSKLAKESNLKNVLVTNGFINQGPLGELLGVIDARNIDLKSCREDTYLKVQKGGLGPVLDTIRTAHGRGCHVELTTLIVTGINDDLDDMLDIIDFIASVDRNIPWHISRYYPHYGYNKPATDVDFIMKVHSEAVKKLNYVYCGNVPMASKGSDTVCPSCGNTVISRRGYSTSVKNLKDGTCSQCGGSVSVRC